MPDQALPSTSTSPSRDVDTPTALKRARQTLAPAGHSDGPSERIEDMVTMSLDPARMDAGSAFDDADPHRPESGFKGFNFKQKTDLALD